MKRQWVESYKNFLTVKEGATDHHIKTEKHTGNASKYVPTDQSNQPEEGNVEFYKDLCEAFTSADIPFRKLNNPTFRNFLEKYCKRNVSDDSILRDNYLGPIFEEKVNKINQQINNKNLWFCVEITEILGRLVVNVITGTLNTSNSTKPYLISCKILEKVNAEIISTSIEEAFLKILPELKPENILFMISDNTPHMLKAGQILQEIFSNLIHLTSLTHALQGICEFVCEEYEHVDKFVNEMRNIFLKSPSRIKFYKEQCPHLPLPPEPMVTGWATWIEAVVFYADNYQAVKNVTNALDSTEKSVADCKQLFKTSHLLKQLNFLKNTFGHIPQAIKQLEAHNLPLTDSMDIFKRTLEKLKIHGELGSDLENHIITMKNQNPGLATLEEISNNIKNNSTDIFQKNFSFVPVAGCDVERNFIQYRDIVTEKRTAFSETNLEKYIVICCNKDL